MAGSDPIAVIIDMLLNCELILLLSKIQLIRNT